MHTKLLATAVAAAALIGLSACSGSDTSSAAFNSADVTFAQDMIPHHRQATEMAQLAAERTRNTDVLGLADHVIAAQQPEIDTMSGWLTSWDKEVPADSSGMGEMEGMDHGSSSSDMPGMMSEEDMSSPQAASGAAFDRQFLTMMIDHHEGAIEMASQEDVDGRFDQAVELAEKIQADQTAEISTMQRLLSS